jgi:hypothetical protein
MVPKVDTAGHLSIMPDVSTSDVVVVVEKESERNEQRARQGEVVQQQKRFRIH